MNWWGKLLGGATGFAVAGPLGALIGAALGHAVDRHNASAVVKADTADATAATQTFFFTATFAVMGHMAKADGKVSSQEIQMARRVMDHMALDRARRHFAQALFRLGKEADFPLSDVLAQLKQESRSRDLRRMFIEIQVFAAYADGAVHPRERTILEKICIALGLDRATLVQVEQLVAAQLRAERVDDATPTLAQDHAVLGIDEAADMETVRRAYRRLMSQHHPDRLVAKGLPEEMIRIATEKTQSIRAAYERIRDARA